VQLHALKRLAPPHFAKTDTTLVQKLGFAGLPMTHALLQNVAEAFVARSIRKETFSSLGESLSSNRE